MGVSTIQMNEKIKILFELGDADRSPDWPDYLHYGFEVSDVPALLALVQDSSLHQADQQSNDVWVPLHAWRILGQLKAAEAVQPLLALFDVLVEDDWAISELSMVMGMIGEPALEPLAVYFMETGHDEFARVMAVDGLAEIVKQYPDLRPQVMARFDQYMADPDRYAGALNGILIGCLMDLEAKDMIDNIRHLFALECVDISCAGDLEEVEIGLGLRTERSTPKPAYNSLPFTPPVQTPVKPDADDLYGLTNYYLLKYGNDDSVLDVSELDGLFAALACAPNMIMPFTWFPAIWAGEELMPAWESEDEIRDFNSLVMGMYNEVMTSMNEGYYEALFLERAGEEKTVLIVDEWCEGFLRGLNLWGPLAAADVGFLEQHIKPMRLFATAAGLEQLLEMDVNEVEQHQQQIEPDLRQVFQYFLERRRLLSQPVRRESAKTGRNDPCPCGSGRKFKKCCLH